MEKHLKTANFLGQMLDNQFQIFGVRFGIAALLDIIPELGDILAATLSFYIVWIAIKMKLPPLKILHMIWNIAINFLLGAIPVVGELTYVFRKANLKNLAILEEYARDSHIIEGEIIHRSSNLGRSI